MKKPITKEIITIHFGLKFSLLKEIDDASRNYLSSYSFDYIRDIVKKLPSELNIKEVHNESSPLYRNENKLLAIDVKNIENVPTVYALVNTEIQKLNEALLYANKEQLTEMGTFAKGKDFSHNIEMLLKDMQIEKIYNKLNKKIKPDGEKQVKKIKI
jgi:hypothetical protein